MGSAENSTGSLDDQMPANILSTRRMFHPIGFVDKIEMI
jgi:hypothetical protein